MKRALSFAVAGCVLLVGTFAAADQMTGSLTGLANPATTLTFDGGVGLADHVIVTQYDGISFTGFGWDNADLSQQGSIGFSGGDLVNGFLGWPTNTTMTIAFNTVVNAAAFAAVDQGGQFTVQAYLSGALVDWFLVTVPSNPGAGYIGFSNESFDTIMITRNGASASSAFSIDNLQVIGPTIPGVCCSTPLPDTSGGPGPGPGPGSGSGFDPGPGDGGAAAVPEPGSLLLFGSGISMLAAILRKKILNEGLPTLKTLR